jgi:mRNA-degrading endonuclease RelE of RelBE toxin-antitoxin system
MEWFVNVTEEAEADLKFLRRRHRKVYQQAAELIGNLELRADTMGDSCEPPLSGVRRLHFWNDEYRLVWNVMPDDRRTDVWAVGRKTSRFYEDVARRLNL